MTPLTSAATASSFRVPRDLPPAPGVTLVDGGIEVSVYAGHAESVDLCLFDAGDSEGATERRVTLVDHAFGWWFGFVPDVGVGQRYGFRVGGAWDPEQGLRHNPKQLLMDPYARAIEGEADADTGLVKKIEEGQVKSDVKRMDVGVYVLPKILDEQVALLHLDHVNAKLTKMTPAQVEYMSLPAEGPFKPDMYRY